MSRSPKARRSLAFLILGVLIVAGAASWLVLRSTGDDGDDGALATTSPTPGPTYLDEPQRWGRLMIQVTKEDGAGREGVQAYFVNKKDTDLILAYRTEQCVKDYLKVYFSAACYAFPSLEALTFAEVNPETGEMGTVCWKAFTSRSQDTRGTIQVDDGQYVDNNCP